MKLLTPIIRLKHIKLLALGLAVSAGWPALATAAESVHYTAQPRGSKVMVAGTSTVHDWTLNGEIIGGYLEVPTEVEFDQSKTDLPGTTGGKLSAKAQVFIPVTSLKAPYEGMDEAMQDAMKAREFSKIQFRLAEMTIQTPHLAGTPFNFEAKGDLTVHGVTNTITMPVTIEKVEPGRLKISGKTSLQMTDYKIAPPVKLGIFRTGDAVTISFDWVVAPPKTARP